MQERASLANYLILPTKYAFPALVRIHAIVFSFVTKCRKGRKILSHLVMEGKLSLQLFSVTFDDETEPARLYGEKPYPQSMAMQVDHMGEGQQIDPRHGLPGDSRIGSRSWTYGDQDISPSAGPIQSSELHHSSIHLLGVSQAS